MIFGDDYFQDIFSFIIFYGNIALGFVNAPLRHNAAHAGRGVNACVPPDHGAGVEDAVAADLHPVAQHGAHLFAAGLDLLALVVDDDGELVTLDIGGDGASAHVGFVAKDGIPHIVIMRHLYIVEQDHVFQLRGVAHHAVIANQRAAADEGTGAHLRLPWIGELLQVISRQRMAQII